MKPSDWKSREYREAVIGMPCVHCGKPGNGHHSKTRPDGQTYGMGQKAPDYEMYPLCHECHQGKGGFHDGPRSWRLGHGGELQYVEQTQEQLAHLIPDEYWEWINRRYRLGTD